VALADFARHLSRGARRRLAGAYLDTLQRLLAFPLDPLQGERSDPATKGTGAGQSGRDRTALLTAAPRASQLTASRTLVQLRVVHQRSDRNKQPQEQREGWE
jgi:hypothetical protein